MPHYADPFLRKQVNADKKKRRDSARRTIYHWRYTKHQARVISIIRHSGIGGIDMDQSGETDKNIRLKQYPKQIKHKQR
ncbi:hypothetical protein CSQ88_16125 [Iodobacter sp. BJB302]|nr:hypothetical protein CSQ88_16125 [Iodobacter sp. BJB302]